MVLRVLISSAALLLSSALSAQGDVWGTWLLSGPGTESEILLTEEGLRIQSEYELLADDPSLYCTPASSSRIWANPGAPIKIELSAERVQITYELFDLRREIPLGDESVLPDMPSTRNLNGTYFSEMGSSFAQYDGERLIIESRNHTLGYVRTSRGIPQSTNTVVTEELQVEDGTLHITHVYTDATLYEKPLVLEYFLERADHLEISLYECTEANYDWFDELNAKK